MSSLYSSLACPVISDRPYSWWSYFSIVPCVLLGPLSASHVSYFSYVHIYTLGLATPVSFSFVCPHQACCSLCASISSSSHDSTTWNVFRSCYWTLALLLLSAWRVRISSMLVTRHSRLSILISFTSSRASCPFFVAQICAHYNRAGLTTVL